jgi:hypothetical protein
MNIQILQSSQWQLSADHVRKPHRETSKSDANVRQRFSIWARWWLSSIAGGKRTPCAARVDVAAHSEMRINPAASRY